MFLFQSHLQPASSALKLVKVSPKHFDKREFCGGEVLVALLGEGPAMLLGPRR